MRNHEIALRKIIHVEMRYLIFAHNFLDFCFSAKMRMQMLKIVVVLLIAGSGDARPQKSGRFHQRNHTRREYIFEGGLRRARRKRSPIFSNKTV